jgi:uncharacterized membrane protein YphA (DoxX/SURF4 family)
MPLPPLLSDSRPALPRPSVVRAFLVLYVIVGVIVCIESIETIIAALHGRFPVHDRRHALMLGILETVAAILFLIPRTMRWGAAGLLAIFALAFLLHLSGGHPNFNLLIYAAAVLFIREHGVRDYRWWSSTI